ncbi:MAG TPA: hypothetical protein VMJ10_20215 [Kofleriaceae bacterium]|nr:hypothetical protein [Kofleriaceae bacterium]
MSALVKSLHPDEKITAGKLGSSMMKAGVGLAVVFLGLSLVLVLARGTAEAGHASKWARFFYAYVVGWCFIATIPIGMLWIILLHFLVRGRWVTVVRRICEAMTGSFLLVWIAGLVFVVPVVAGYQDLYYWATPDAHDAALNPVLQHKLGWLSPGFFFIRYIAYGAIYVGLSSYFAKKSREQDESGDPKITDHLRKVAGPGMIVYAFVTAFVGFDVLMSLAPKWYSTIFGVTFWGSGCVGAFSALALIVLWVQRSGRLVHSVTEEHYHDIGKWMFAFTFFWAYVQFSQFMLQWYGNMPDETIWYKYRMFGDWQWVSIAMLVGFWAFPFVFLMSRWTKRIVPSLVFFAVWQLVFHWLDLYWNAMPQFDWYQPGNGLNAGPLAGNLALHHVGFDPVDITVWIGLIGVLLAGIGGHLKGNLIPVKDPTLGLSLGHEQL